MAYSEEYVNKLRTPHHFENVSFEDGDVLFVIDMQRDFVPNAHEIAPSTFAVRGGESIVFPIGVLIKQFLSKDRGYIIASRDYHPHDHKSFATEYKEGLFPYHCIQGTPGSEIVPRIARVLGKKDGTGLHEQAYVVFKGLDSKVDSYGAVQYCRKNRGTCVGGGCTLYSGSFILKCSGHRQLEEDKKKYPELGVVPGTGNVNAAPDIILRCSERKMEQSRAEKLHCVRDAQNVFVVGLALDFCVIDTAINLRNTKKNVYVIVDLARPAFIEKIGAYVTPPETLLKMADKAGVQFIELNNIKHLPRVSSNFYGFFGTNKAEA